MKINGEEILFYLTAEAIQFDAKKRIGRRLNNEEMSVAKKCVEWGLWTDIDTVFNTAIDEAVKIENQ